MEKIISQEIVPVVEIAIDCPCQKAKKCVDTVSLLDEFAVMREQCAALKEILVPEAMWLEFQLKEKECPDSVGHKNKVIGAFQHGNLSKITLLIHRIVLGPIIKRGQISFWLLLEYVTYN